MVWYCECTAESADPGDTDERIYADVIRPQGTCECFLLSYRVDAQMPDGPTQAAMQACDMSLELSLIDNDFIAPWEAQDDGSINGSIPRRLLFRRYLPPIQANNYGTYPGWLLNAPRTTWGSVGAAEDSPTSGTQPNPLGNMWGPMDPPTVEAMESPNTKYAMFGLTGENGVYLPKPFYVGYGGGMGVKVVVEAGSATEAPRARFRFIFLCAQELADLLPFI